MADIEDGVRREVNAAEIHRKLLRDFNESRVPTVRTVSNIVRDLRPPAPTEAWRPGNFAAAEEALILPVLGSLIQKSDGRRKTITNSEAEWIVRVRTSAPDLPNYAVFQLADFYARRRELGKPTDDVDALLAFAPWRGLRACQKWSDAVAAEWIRRPALSWTMVPVHTDTVPYFEMLERLFDRRLFVRELWAVGADYATFLREYEERETLGQIDVLTGHRAVPAGGIIVRKEEQE